MSRAELKRTAFLLYAQHSSVHPSQETWCHPWFLSVLLSPSTGWVPVADSVVSASRGLLEAIFFILYFFPNEQVVKFLFSLPFFIELAVEVIFKNANCIVPFVVDILWWLHNSLETSSMTLIMSSQPLHMVWPFLSLQSGTRIGCACSQW